MLNVLLSFAQFEWETTAERTAAKIRARVQRGMWNDGYVLFGYDYSPSRQMLLPDEEEARTVSHIFRVLVTVG